MPKQVLDELIARLVRDIERNYSAGDRYRSLREIADGFDVSYQTAQKGLARLQELGVVESRRRSGTTVLGTRPEVSLTGKTVFVISNQHEKRFDAAFFEGIREVAEAEGVVARFLENEYPDPRSLGFGDYLIGLDADAVIALAFRDSALPFYHAMRGGLDIVADIILDELPILPAVQTDNFRHALEAGRRLAGHGFSEFIVVGYYPHEHNKRYQGFLEGLRGRDAEVTYLCLRDSTAMSAIDRFLHDFGRSRAVFSTDYSANHILGAKFIQHGIDPSGDRFVVYDSERGMFHYTGLSPVRSVAPSLHTLGKSLCSVLLTKWKRGAFEEPLQRKI